MNRSSLLAGLLAGGFVTNVYAGCEQPPLVVIPPAEEIDESDSTVHDETTAYFQAMQAYVDCIRAELEAGGENASQLFKLLLVQRNNLAVAEAEAVQRWYESRFPTASTSNRRD